MERNSIDALRLLFASLVAVWHIADLSQANEFQALLSFIIPPAHLAVNAFFVLSGFLIVKSYSGSDSNKVYFLKRVNRLLPAYVCSVLFFSLFLSLFSQLSVKEYFFSGSLVKYLAVNLLFLNFLQPCLPGVFMQNPECSVNVALWTIKIEVLFYLVIPGLVSVLNKVSKKVYLLVLIYVVSIMYKCIFISLDNHQKGIYEVLSRQLPGYMSYFTGGMLLYYYFKWFILNKNKLVLISLPIYVIEWYLDVEFLRPFCVAIIVFYFAYSLPWLNNFGRFGDYSYGTYVFHAPIIQILIAVGLFSYSPSMAAFICCFVIALIAFLSWKYIEEPAKTLRYNV